MRYVPLFKHCRLHAPQLKSFLFVFNFGIFGLVTSNSRHMHRFAPMQKCQHDDEMMPRPNKFWQCQIPPEMCFYVYFRFDSMHPFNWENGSSCVHNDTTCMSHWAIIVLRGIFTRINLATALASWNRKYTLHIAVISGSDICRKKEKTKSKRQNQLQNPVACLGSHQ